MAQDAGVEPGGACQRFQPQNEEFIILEERQQGHMQGHIQRDDAFPFARLPRKTGHQVDGPPVEHRHGQQQWDKDHARERIKKEIADEQKRPVFPFPLTQQPARDKDEQEKGCELQRNEIHLCLSGQKVMRKGARSPHDSENARPLQANRLGVLTYPAKRWRFQNPIEEAAETPLPGCPDNWPCASPFLRCRRTDPRGCA